MPTQQQGLFEEGLHTANAIGCPHCGAVLDEDSLGPQFSDLLLQLEEVQEKYEAVKEESAKHARTVKKLRRDGDADLRNSAEYEPAVEVLNYWRDLCHPEARELTGGERIRKVIARLRGKPKPYTPEILKLAVYGYARFPYVDHRGKRSPQGSPAQRFIDAELIFRDPKHVDQGLALAKEAKHRDAQVAPDPQTPPTPETDVDKALRLLDEE